MSLSHHGNPEDLAIRARFADQILGAVRRNYSAGRMGADDDGDLSFAIATDTRHQAIVIRFGKPVEWIGFGREDAERLIEQLQQRVYELRGITV